MTALVASPSIWQHDMLPSPPELMSLALLAPTGIDFPLIGKVAMTAIVLLYVGVPLLSLAMHSQPAKLTAMPLLSLDIVRQLDPEAATYLQDAASRLAALGFTVGQPLRLPTSEVSVGYAILGEKPDGDIAETCVLVRRVEAQVIRREWTNFHSHTRNVARTVTSNAISDSGIPSRGGVNSFSAPGVKDLARLYELHRVRVRDFGGRRRGAPALGNPAAFAESEWAASTDNMVARGYARLSGKDGEKTLRLTAKGAFLIAWRQLPPWNKIAEARARRDVAALEARIIREVPLERSA